MDKLTKEKLFGMIEKVTVAEVLSSIAIDHRTGAVDVKDEELVDIAFLAQYPDERAGAKFMSMVKDKRLELFFDHAQCPFPLESKISAIFLDDIIVCKK